MTSGCQRIPSSDQRTGNRRREQDVSDRCKENHPAKRVSHTSQESHSLIGILAIQSKRKIHNCKRQHDRRTLSNRKRNGQAIWKPRKERQLIRPPQLIRPSPQGWHPKQAQNADEDRLPTHTVGQSLASAQREVHSLHGHHGSIDLLSRSSNSITPPKSALPGVSMKHRRDCQIPGIRQYLRSSLQLLPS